MELGVESVTISPGFKYERAPRQDIFLGRDRSKQLFRDLLRHGRGKRWRFNQSSLFLDFLAGNQSYACTPWGNPTRNVFGWQKPCYLLVGEGYAQSFRELMDETPWEQYGVGKHAKCAQCQVHCGFEPTAVDDTFRHPLKALRVALRGPRTEGPFARDLAADGPFDEPPPPAKPATVRSAHEPKALVPR
jgi:hopanoid biosynthesis associated radical SAM protein HpnH